MVLLSFQILPAIQLHASTRMIEGLQLWEVGLGMVDGCTQVYLLTVD